MSVIHTGSFGQLWPISWTITHCFGVLEWFPWLTNPVVRLCVGHQHSQFWRILAHFLDYYSLFWGSGVISTINELNPGVRLCAGQQHSQFLSILPRFMVYYSLFWGPGAISIIDAPRGAFTCRSPAIVILFDSARFVDYYSLFWGPGVSPMIDEPQGALTCRSSTLTVLANSGPFR